MLKSMKQSDELLIKTALLRRSVGENYHILNTFLLDVTKVTGPAMMTMLLRSLFIATVCCISWYAIPVFFTLQVAVSCSFFFVVVVLLLVVVLVVVPQHNNWTLGPKAMLPCVTDRHLNIPVIFVGKYKLTFRIDVMSCKQLIYAWTVGCYKCTREVSK